MATTRPFAYNTGSVLSGTTQYGTLSVGVDRNLPYSENYGGLRWWMGPDEDLGYCIGTSEPTNTQPTQPGIIPPFGNVKFWRTENLDDNQFISLSNKITDQNFTSSAEAVTWLNENGYWTSYAGISPSPTPTPTQTATNTPTPSVTPTSTLTPTPSNTPSDESLVDPIITENDEYIEVGSDEYLMFVDPVEPSPTPTNTPTQTVTPTITPTTTPTPSVTPTTSITPTTSQSVSSITLSVNYSLGSGSINWCNKTLEELSEATCDAVSASYQVQNFIGTEISVGTQFNGVQAYNQCWVTNTNWPSQILWFSGDTQYIIETDNSGVVTRYESFVVCTPPTPTPTPTNTPTNSEVPVTPTPTPTQGVSGDFNVTISQEGPDVVWNGSGSFNLDALTSAGSNTMTAGFQASQAIWAIGPNASVDTYSGTITYPTTFGSGSVGVTSSSGSTFGILPGGSGRLLYVPSGYVSNTTISGSATYASQTIAGMGLTSGTYTWSWGSGGNTSTLVMTIG